MYSCVFWLEFINLVVIFLCYEESDRGHTITAKKKNAPNNIGIHQRFIL